MAQALLAPCIITDCQLVADWLARPAPELLPGAFLYSGVVKEANIALQGAEAARVEKARAHARERGLTPVGPGDERR
eukprot:6982031-Lingulodinium_polyedra.AAC.1